MYLIFLELRAGLPLGKLQRGGFLIAIEFASSLDCWVQELFALLWSIHLENYDLYIHSNVCCFFVLHKN